MQVCSNIFVLDFGQLMAEGDPGRGPGRPEGPGGVPRHREGGGGVTAAGRGFLTASDQRATLEKGQRLGRDHPAAAARTAWRPRRRTAPSRCCTASTSSVPAGGVLAVLGPNGAGKSTMLRVVGGLHPPTSGDIFLGGRRVNGVDPVELARAGMCTIPEGRGIFPNLTVKENLQMVTYRGRGPQGGRGAGVLRTSRGCPSGAPRWPARCPVASSRCSRSPVPSPATRACCCSTSCRWDWPRSSSTSSTRPCGRSRRDGVTILRRRAVRRRRARRRRHRRRHGGRRGRPVRCPARSRADLASVYLGGRPPSTTLSAGTASSAATSPITANAKVSP